MEELSEAAENFNIAHQATEVEDNETTKPHSAGSGRTSILTPPS